MKVRLPGAAIYSNLEGSLDRPVERDEDRPSNKTARTLTGKLFGECYPCAMGWGLAGTGNSSAVVVPPGGYHKITSLFKETRQERWNNISKPTVRQNHKIAWGFKEHVQKRWNNISKSTGWKRGPRIVEKQSPQNEVSYSGKRSHML